MCQAALRVLPVLQGGFVFFSFLHVACQHETDETGVGMQLQDEKEPNILLTY